MTYRNTTSTINFINTRKFQRNGMIGVNSDIFIQLGIVIILAALAAFILRLFRQPQLLAYILVGILITPVFGLITDTSLIESM
jgi:Kef-type K+ transport system membrane component KefB